MTEVDIVSGQDVDIFIDGKELLQAENMEVRTVSEIHKIRSCFRNDDIAHIKTKNQYKVSFTGLKFKKIFENCNFYDLDNFTVTVIFGSTKITLGNCMWNDFLTVADKSKFRESISITALKMTAEDTE